MGARVYRDTAVGPAEGFATLPAARKAGGGLDLPLAVAMAAMLVFGLIMVYSASWDFSLGLWEDPMRMFNRQVLWVILGSLLAYFISRLDYHYWRPASLVLMAVTAGLLLLVLLFNNERFGAVRSFLAGSVQPSELAKLITVIYLAVWLHSKREQLHDISWGLLPLAVILGLIGGLIYLQPDLSATATIFILGGLLFFLAGGDLRQIAMLLVLAVIVGVLVVQVSDTGRDRMNSFVLGIQDPLQASYHVRRSLEAIVKGGIFGVGIGQSTTKLLGLPVPPTDSIFAVIAEELGIFGAIGTITLYGLIVWRGLKISQQAPDMLGSLLAGGLTFWIASEAAINMLVIVGLMPFAGNALPFISAGGSSLVTSLVAIGIILNVSRQAGQQPATTGASAENDDWRNYGAIFDLRRRDRRRSVSRLSRPSGRQR